MKAVVWQGVGEIGLENVPEPKLESPEDAIVRITASAICGTDLHFVRGTMPDMKPGTILGHEAAGVVEELGSQVRNLAVGDRVVIPSTIGCGRCVYCRAGYYAQCDVANPNGPDAGTSFYGGPESTGPPRRCRRSRVSILAAADGSPAPVVGVGVVRGNPV
jgi:threonine dehydrogenase-like Zn-dependent dehydrogenase